MATPNVFQERQSPVHLVCQVASSSLERAKLADHAAAFRGHLTLAWPPFVGDQEELFVSMRQK